MIAWGCGSQAIGLNQRGPIEYAFDLQHLDFLTLDKPVGTTAAQAGSPSVRWDPSHPRRLQVSAPVGGSASMFELPDTLDQIRCFATTPNSLLVGSDGGLRRVLLDSMHRSQTLSGHSGTVWAVSLSPDGKRLISAGDDRTLRIWSLKENRLMATLFFAGREWIAWLPAGPFAASPGGEDLLAWYLPRDANQLGEVHAAAQFHKSMYQPEVVRQILLDGDGSTDAHIAYPPPTTARVSSSRRSHMVEVIPPLVKITQPLENPHHASAPLLNVEAIVDSRGGDPLTSVRLLLDGRPYEGRKGVQVVRAMMLPRVARTHFHGRLICQRADTN